MSEQLDVYTYALNKGARFSVGSTGREWIARCVNPQCSSKHDAFSVQPEGKHTGRWANRGAWMCRKCWDPSEMVTVQYGPGRGTRRKRGWGNIVDLVMLCEGMVYQEAERFVLEYEGTTVPIASRPPLQARKTDEVWFAESMEYLKQSQIAGQAEQKLVHAYLASRGLTLETAKRLGFGYSLDPIPMNDGSYRKIPFLVIPWYKDKAANILYRKIGRRNLHNPLPDDESKYYVRGQSDRDMLYLGESLLQEKRPTFLVEGELCAATILQEAGDLVNAVATGSTEHGKGPVTEGRLRRQPFVFLSGDVDAKGEAFSQEWQGKLDNKKCIRYRPLMHDVNEMHVHGLSVRKWVEDALAYFVAPVVSIAPVQLGTRLTSERVREIALRLASDADIHLVMRDRRVCLDAPFEVGEKIKTFIQTYESELLAWLTEEASTERPHIGVEVLDISATDYIAARKREIAQHKPLEPTLDEQYIINKLGSYDVRMACYPCHRCGCRLVWQSLGEISCARCEPGGLWSNATLARIKETCMPLEGAR